ncbi:MAG: GlsB/YeaQ/YmgE family stress response membrane protein [Hyphomicrobiaceae bacterium]|nr:GlsB/YeaQ/YmgE family stress response membrane protein [Hyphomicrobiaceae bacterium]
MPNLAAIEPYKLYIILALVGLIAGWLSGLLLGGGGLIRNLVVGILGAIVGGVLVNLNLLPVPNIPIPVPYIREIAVATIGAIIVTIIARVLAGRR